MDKNIQVKLTSVDKIIPQLSPNGQTVFCKRYPQRGEQYNVCQYCQKKHESPQELFERVSLGNIEYYNLMANLDFLPNSPTLFNANVPNFEGTLSACFKFDVQDSMLGSDSIMDVACKAAAVQKWGGGVGYYLGNLREKGAPIKSTHGKACGPVSVMLNLYQGVAMMITQGGKREGAQMGILPVNHPDIREFIHCKDNNPQALSTFNISVAMTDDIMRKIYNVWQELNQGIIPSEEDKEAFNLLKEMAKSAWKTGDPGCYFIDISEKTNPTPWLGKLTGTNPCGEVPLLNNEPCNLGSINLLNCLRLGSSFRKLISIFDYDELKRIIITATRFLDNILDINKFPHLDINRMAKTTRKLGLGVMGLADVLAVLEIPYDSVEALEFSRSVMEYINKIAEEESKKLADEKGPYPGVFLHPNINDEDLYEESLADNFSVSHIPEDVKDVLIDMGLWIRNATRTCIAPTGSISILAGVSSGIEPHFSLNHTRKMGESSGGVSFVEKPAFEEKKKEFGITNNFIPKTALELNWKNHIDIQDVFQEHTNLAVSKTINMPQNAPEQDILDAYITAWCRGCKGITVYRDKSREVQVLETKEDNLNVNSLIINPKKGQDVLFSVSNKSNRPKSLPSVTDKIKTNYGNLYVTITFLDDKPYEVFAAGKQSNAQLVAEIGAITTLASRILRMGGSVDIVIRSLKGINAGNGVWDDGHFVSSISDAIAYVLEKHTINSSFGIVNLEEMVSRKPNPFHNPTIYGGEPSIAVEKGKSLQEAQDYDKLCSECNNFTLVFAEGCKTCQKCGFSDCG